MHETREHEAERTGRFFAALGFPRIPPHDEPAYCREAWLRGWDAEQAGEAAPEGSAAR